MKAQETTVEKVLGGRGTQFRVPLYQRPYSWSHKHWEPLWDVVVQQATAVAENDRSSGHFLGSIVLAPSVVTAGGPQVWLVVDGQQRLTTLSVLLCALRDRIRGEDADLASDIHRGYLINERERDQFQWKLLPTQADRGGYQACLDGSPLSGNLGEAYRYFQQKLLEYDDPDDPHDLHRIQLAIERRLELVEITAGQDDNVHRIFESLNHTGLDLTQADLLRNYLFMLLPTRGDEVYRHYWQPMEQCLDGDSRQLTWLAWLDLVMRGDARATAENTYESHRHRLRHLESGDEAGAEREVAQLARRAGYLRLMLHPEEEPHAGVRAALGHFIGWGTNVADAVGMVLLERRGQGSTTDDEVAEALRLLESFLVRRMICGVPTNNLNRILNALPREVLEGSVVDRVRTYLSRERHYWPTDDQLRTAVLERNFYWSGRQHQRGYVLRRLEESFAHREPVDWERANLTIEHVMPQTLSQSWRTDLKKLVPEGESVEDVHRAWLHTLGNLTMTGYNSEMSNRRFDRKRDQLAHSGLAMNHEIAQCDVWGPEQIGDRARRLADRAVSLWPAPLPREEATPVEKASWKLLRQAMVALPAGTWTTYGELAEVIGSHPVPVGVHVASKPVPNPWRVLTSEGKVSSQFRWSNSDRDDDPVDLLRAEGVKFDEAGRADPASRLSAREIAELIDLDGSEPVAATGGQEANAFEHLLAGNQSTATVAGVQQVLAFWQRKGGGLSYGSGKDTSCTLTISRDQDSISPFQIYPISGRVEVVFQYLKTRPPFDDPELRDRFRQVCNAIPHVDIPRAKIDVRPGFDIDVLENSEAVKALCAALDWFLGSTAS